MKKELKILFLVIAMVTIVANSFMVFAESAVINNAEMSQNDRKERAKEFKKLENQITGKILSIDSNNVIIAVAKRKKMERPEKSAVETEVQKSVFDDVNKEKINIDDMYTLTGENKTINISQANFGKKFEKQDSASNEIEKEKRVGIDKTYADYQVGEYVTIECTDGTYQVAKNMNKSGMRGGMRGGFERRQSNENRNNEIFNK